MQLKMAKNREATPREQPTRSPDQDTLKLFFKNVGLEFSVSATIFLTPLAIRCALPFMKPSSFINDNRTTLEEHVHAQFGSLYADPVSQCLVYLEML